MLDTLLKDLQDKDIPVSNLLRKAKVIAHRSKQEDFLQWINDELNGYDNKKVPDYRMVRGQVKAWNPYRGWIPVLFQDREIEDTISYRGVSHSVSEIESLLSKNSATYEMPYPDAIAAQMIKDHPTKAMLEIGNASLVGILNSVRNRLLDLALSQEDNSLDSRAQEDHKIVIQKPSVEGPKSNEIELLDRFYKGFTDQAVPRDFFLKLYDYIEYVNTTPTFDYITARLLEKGKPLQDKMTEASTKAVARLDAVRKDIDEYIKKKNVVNDGIKEWLREYDSYKKGHISSSLPIPTSLHNALSDTIQILEAMPEHKPFTKKYVQYYNGTDKVKYYLWLQESKDFDRAKAEYDAASRTEIWGQTPLLGQVFQTIKDGKKHKEALQQAYEAGKGVHLGDMGVSILVSEWEAVRDGKLPTMLNGSPRRNPLLFEIQKIKPIADRLHLYILKEYAEYEIVSDEVKKHSAKPVLRTEKRKAALVLRRISPYSMSWATT